MEQEHPASKTGWIEIKSLVPSGGVLWALWAVEAAIIFSLAIALSLTAKYHQPFCERCSSWCEESGAIVHLDSGVDNRDDALRTRFEGIEALLERGSTASVTGLSGSCVNMLKHRKALWTFVEEHGVEPTFSKRLPLVLAASLLYLEQLLDLALKAPRSRAAA